MFLKDTRKKDIIYNISSCRGFKLEKDVLEICYESGRAAIVYTTEEEASQAFKRLQDGIRRGDHLVII